VKKEANQMNVTANPFLKQKYLLQLKSSITKMKEKIFGINCNECNEINTCILKVIIMIMLIIIQNTFSSAYFKRNNQLQKSLVINNTYT